MCLNLENGETWDNPSSYQIEEALRKLEHTSNSFLILERDSEGYMQIAGDEESGYYLEYRSASSGKQYRCVDRSLSFETSVEILKGYAAKNRRWRISHGWNEIDVENNSGGVLEDILSPSVMLLIIGISGAWAIYAFESKVEHFLNIEIGVQDSILLTTIGIGMAVPYSIRELSRWRDIEWDTRIRMIALVCLFLTMLALSIDTFLR